MPTPLCPKCGMYCGREVGFVICHYCGFDPLEDDWPADASELAPPEDDGLFDAFDIQVHLPDKQL